MGTLFVQQNSVIKGPDRDTAMAEKDDAARKAELNDTLREYISEWRKTREAEEEELKKLKDKQDKRKQKRRPKRLRRKRNVSKKPRQRDKKCWKPKSSPNHRQKIQENLLVEGIPEGK